MLSNVKNMFKVEDLRNKILFTLCMVAVYRFGSALRVPGVDGQAVKQLREASNSQGALGFLNLFSGGAFGSFSIFALGIMPYITSSIIMQVLGVVIPKLEQWQQEGAVGQRRIPVQFAKRVVGRKMFGGNSTYLPLKVNQAGVVPIIFASSVLLLPVLLSNMLGSAEGWRGSIARFVNDYMVNSQNMLYISLFFLMIIAFAYFYNSIAFDPIRQADQLRKQGGFVPGIRPGPQTESFLAKAVNRITLPGALFVAFIAILPYIILWMGDVQSFPFAGTTVLIAVGVALELMRQIDSQLMQRNYEGFLK